MARRKKHEDDESQQTEKKTEPPITQGEPTEDNPSGITAVSDEHAMRLGEARGDGGPGAAGATVAGPAVHVATEGGSKPLPVRRHLLGEEQVEEEPAKTDEE